MENKTKQINLKDLASIIKEEAKKVLKEVHIEDMGYPNDLKNMNYNDVAKDTAGNKVDFNKKHEFPKNRGTKAYEGTKETNEVEMNSNDKEQGQDGAQSEVKASNTTNSGDFTKGQHKADFVVKKSEDLTKESTPFEEVKKREDINMEEHDKDNDNAGTKAFVEAGAEKKNAGFSTGQAKAKSSESAQNEKETAKRIASAIQLPESFKNKKELLEFVKTEAKKIAKQL